MLAHNHPSAGEGGQTDFEKSVFDFGLLEGAELVLKGAIGKFRTEVEFEFGRFVGAVVKNEDAVVQVGTDHGVLIAIGFDGAAAAVADGRML